MGVYRQPRVVVMLFLGFSAGLPFLLVFSTLSAWLSDYGIERSIIGFFSWIGITYSIKFFWAPVIDRLTVPPFTSHLGQRRGWMLIAQSGIALGLIGMASIGPQGDLATFALLALVVAFSSATQDISIDAYRIEAVVKEYQGAMAATYILGYRIALLTAGAGAFYIAEFANWNMAYLTMAALMAVGMITVLMIDEPAHHTSRETALREQRVMHYLANSTHQPAWLRRFNAWFIGAVVCPFVDFFARNGIRLALFILLFVGVYRISDITMGVMANPFYLELGYTKPQIASIAKVFGFFMSIGGAAVGGLLVVRYGILRPLLLGAFLVATTNLIFALMAWMNTTDLTILAIAISADNLSGGLAGASFIAYLSSLTNTAYTATQYALFSSLMTLPAKFIGGFSGVAVDAWGYSAFFIYASVLGIPAIFLVLYLMRRSNSTCAASKPL